jgi:hypothetical protein
VNALHYRRGALSLSAIEVDPVEESAHFLRCTNISQPAARLSNLALGWDRRFATGPSQAIGKTNIF